MIHCNIVTFSIVIPFQINCKTHCNSFSCDDVLLKYHYYYYYYYYLNCNCCSQFAYHHVITQITVSHFVSNNFCLS